MKVVHVNGKNKGKLLLYALSTCVWCKKIREFLEKNGVEYDYIYMDHLEDNDREEGMEDLKKWNPRCSFPTLVIKDKKCVIGFREEEIKEELGL